MQEEVVLKEKIEETNKEIDTCEKALDTLTTEYSKQTTELVKGTDEWNSRHMASGGLTNKNIHLTKHLAQIASNIELYVPKLAQKLNVAFKQENT